MRSGNHPKKIAFFFVYLSLGMPASMVACASSNPTRASGPDFNGTWSVDWCDQAYPKSECGTFSLQLIQYGERICGQHFAATPRLSKLEEGDPGSVIGTYIGNKAVILVNNSRSGEKNLATLTLTKNGLEWHVVGVAVAGERPWDGIIGGDWVLKKDKSARALSAWRALKESPCQWPDELPSN